MPLCETPKRGPGRPKKMILEPTPQQYPYQGIPDSLYKTPAPFKRPRGRPRGSTIQKILERNGIHKKSKWSLKMEKKEKIEKKEEPKETETLETKPPSTIEQLREAYIKKIDHIQSQPLEFFHHQNEQEQEEIRSGFKPVYSLYKNENDIHHEISRFWPRGFLQALQDGQLDSILDTSKKAKHSNLIPYLWYSKSITECLSWATPVELPVPIRFSRAAKEKNSDTNVCVVCHTCNQNQNQNQNQPSHSPKMVYAMILQSFSIDSLHTMDAMIQLSDGPNAHSLLRGHAFSSLCEATSFLCGYPVSYHEMYTQEYWQIQPFPHSHPTFWVPLTPQALIHMQMPSDLQKRQKLEFVIGNIMKLYSKSVPMQVFANAMVQMGFHVIQDWEHLQLNTSQFFSSIHIPSEFQFLTTFDSAFSTQMYQRDQPLDLQFCNHITSVKVNNPSVSAANSFIIDDKAKPNVCIQYHSLYGEFDSLFEATIPTLDCKKCEIEAWNEDE